METYEIYSSDREYYTASEVAEIKGLDKNTILNRCKKGYYNTAVKRDPSLGNPHGLWLIRKSEIDTPTMSKDVATFTRQITPLELEKAINQAIAAAVFKAVAPLSEKIEKQTAEIEELKILLGKAEKLNSDRMSHIYNIQNSISNSIESISGDTRELRRSHAQKGFWSKLFGD